MNSFMRLPIRLAGDWLTGWQRNSAANLKAFLSWLKSHRWKRPPPFPEPNKVTKLKVLDHLDEQAQAFLATSPFLLLSTVGADGLVEVSPKGDERGFVRIEDARALVIPDRAGNNLAFGHINILANPNVGLIFMSPGTGETLRVSGRATLHDDADLLQALSARGKLARLAMRVQIQHTYFHCARSLLRAGLWETEERGRSRR